MSVGLQRLRPQQYAKHTRGYVENAHLMPSSKCTPASLKVCSGSDRAAEWKFEGSLVEREPRLAQEKAVEEGLALWVAPKQQAAYR